MATHRINRSLRVGEAFETLVAGTYQLDARPNKPTACVRRVHCYNAATITSMKDPGENDDAPGAVPAGTVFDLDVSAITFSGGPIQVAW